jgi:hypothetical protein
MAPPTTALATSEGPRPAASRTAALASREGPRLAAPCDTFMQRRAAGHDLSHERGQQDACTAIAAGELAFEFYGYPGECLKEYGRILHDEYRTNLRGTVGCVVEATSLGYVAGFNGVMAAEFTRRYGKDTLAEVGQRACGH